ncbi:BREX system serine/threonine kinase PglW [Nonomuraea sp. NPDC046802]|uniref:BREX system serine/threonine kinase PglW n=1 Tax=Nonomuraea sp. NPDC046802 TaxID=3154919 RepID=UPI0033E5967C
MEPGSKRWVEVTPSDYTHERGGLAAIRAQLDDDDPYRAWSNFTFTTRSGRQYEVDLLIIGRGGLYLLELKHWSGRIEGDHQTWVHGGRADDNPRILADLKAKHLKQLLLDTGGRDLPFIHAGVVLHDPTAEIRLTDRGRSGVYRIDGQGPDGLAALIREELTVLPRNPRNIVDRSTSRELAKLIERAGVRRSVRHRRVGSMELQGDPIAEGPGWQDYLAQPRLGRIRRVRFYLVEQAASQESRDAIRRAADREFVMLESVNHPGIARAIEFYEHERGPVVAFDHDPTEVRLDHFLRQKFEELSVDKRVDLVRTLASTLHYAHSRRLVHRRLSPLSVFVRNLGQGRYGVRIRDWHTAAKLTSGSPLPASRTLESLTDQGAHGYIAPETFSNPKASSILADVFGLGALAFLIFTGKSPADSTDALRQRLAREGGLNVGVELDGATQKMIDLIREATNADTDLRTGSVEEFARSLEDVLAEVTAQEQSTQKLDPLDAVPGWKLGTVDDPVRFEVVQRLGAGSTAVALLVKDKEHGQAVLKVALDEHDARRRLLDEAEVLSSAREPRIARPLDAPLQVGSRTALLLQDAGRENLAALIRRESRLSLDFLGRWGEDLLDIVAALELTGIYHRDIKPDNLSYRELGANRKVHLTLFDFSLSRAPLEETNVGTPPYLDPFFDRVHRREYDQEAEYYAAAVTLFELATGQTPLYGGGGDPLAISSDVTIEPDLFEDNPARDGLITFFRAALSRDLRSRYRTIDLMRQAWRSIFSSVPPAAATSASVNPLTGEELDQRASRATLDTPIASAGLTPRSVDALHRIDVRTVRDLLARSAFELSRLSGVADPTKREIRRRAKQWRVHLQPAAAIPVGDDGPQDDSGHGIEAVLRSLLPKKESKESQVLRLYLGLEESGSAWPSNNELGAVSDVTGGRIGQILPASRRGWRQKRLLSQIRDEIVDLVADAGGVISSESLAETLLTAHGSEASGEARMRRALGLARAAVEVEAERGGAARLLHRRTTRGAVVALDVDPDAVPGTDLLDYAARLGKVADRIAVAIPIPDAVQVEARLRDVRRPDDLAELPAERLAALAAGASETAAANGRGEIYPDRMDPVQALRHLASSFGVLRRGLNPEQLKARVRARYPRVAPLPDRRTDLDQLLEAADVPLQFDGHSYMPKVSYPSIIATPQRPEATRVRHRDSRRDSTDFERRMETSLSERGFVTLTIGIEFHEAAVDALRARFGIEVFDVTTELMASMRTTAEENGVDWLLVLRADRPDASPQDQANLRQLVALASASLEQTLLTSESPLLVVEAAPLARYGRLAPLERLADKATSRPAARWLLLPMDSGGGAEIERRPAPGALGAVRLSTAWVESHQPQTIS